MGLAARLGVRRGRVDTWKTRVIKDGGPLEPLARAALTFLNEVESGQRPPEPVTADNFRAMLNEVLDAREARPPRDAVTPEEPGAAQDNP